MTYTCTTIFGKRLEARLEPWRTDDLMRLADSIGQMFQPILELAEESGSDGEAGYVPAYGALLDPVTCPYKDLGYLGNYVGEVIPITANEAEARERIKHPAGIERGTLASLEALLKKALGETPFFILERTKSVEGDDAYFITIIIPKGHVTAAIYPEINQTIPAGIGYTILERSGTWFVVAAGKKWSAVKAGLAWSEVVEGEP